MIRHVAGLAEVVDDVDEAERFYVEALGLKVKQRTAEGYVILELPGVLHFGVWSRAQAAQAIHGDPGQAERVPLGFHLELEAEDVDAAESQLREAGCELLHGAQDEPWKQRTLRLLSPSGGLLGLAGTPWARRLTAEPATSAED